MQPDNIIFEGKGFKLSNFKEVHQGKVLYQFNLIVEAWGNSSGLTIKNCKLIQHDGNRFIAFPQRKYTSKDGEEKWTSDIYIAEEVKKRLDESVGSYLKERFKS